MDFIFNEKECNEAKKILGKYSPVSDIWRGTFAPSNKIGNCTNLYRLHKPKNCKDFFEKYISYAAANKDKDVKERGLSFEELMVLAERYKTLAEQNMQISYDLSVYLNDALCHIIVETFNGQNREKVFSDFLEGYNSNYKCSKFDGSIDAKYGVDIKVVWNNGIEEKTSAIQIKPLSFFKSNRSDVNMDRIGLCRKYEEFYREYDIKTYYAIYTTDKETGITKWVKNGDKFRFKINELFNYDPSDIGGTFTRLPLPETYAELSV